jgi:hypothetical protein
MEEVTTYTNINNDVTTPAHNVTVCLL